MPPKQGLVVFGYKRLEGLSRLDSSASAALRKEVATDGGIRIDMFGDLLAEELRKQNLTVRRFAKYAGLSHEVVRQYILGNRLPKESSLAKIIGALEPIPGTSRAELLRAYEWGRKESASIPTSDIVNLTGEQKLREDAAVIKLTEEMMEVAGMKPTAENYESCRQRVVAALTGLGETQSQQKHTRRKGRTTRRGNGGANDS